MTEGEKERERERERERVVPSTHKNCRSFAKSFSGVLNLSR